MNTISTIGRKMASFVCFDSELLSDVAHIENGKYDKMDKIFSNGTKRDKNGPQMDQNGTRIDQNNDKKHQIMTK